MEEDPTTNMAWSPTRIAGQKRTLEERRTEEEESEEGEFEEGEEEEGEEGSEEDSLDQERMPEEGDCEAWENDTRPENRTAEEASTGQKMREGGEKISGRDAEVTGSLGTERLASQAGSEAEHHSSQGREKTARSEQHHTPAETGLKQVPLCWTEEEQGIRRKNCDRPEPREAGNSLRGCLQEHMSGQAGNSSYEGRAEASKGHREGRDTEERDKGGTEKRQTSLEERAGRTAPHKEGAQEVARLREAELHNWWEEVKANREIRMESTHPMWK